METIKNGAALVKIEEQKTEKKFNQHQMIQLQDIVQFNLMLAAGYLSIFYGKNEMRKNNSGRSTNDRQIDEINQFYKKYV